MKILRELRIQNGFLKKTEEDGRQRFSSTLRGSLGTGQKELLYLYGKVTISNTGTTQITLSGSEEVIAGNAVILEGASAAGLGDGDSVELDGVGPVHVVSDAAGGELVITKE